MRSAVEAELAVREYLLFVQDPEQLVDKARLEALQKAVAKATDPIERLKALAQLEKAQQPKEAQYRDAFVHAARGWAEANDVSPTAFLSMGVDRSVLQAAGLLDAGRRRVARSSPIRSTSKNTTAEEIKQAIASQSGSFTITDIAAAAGGSPMTIRKAINELIEAGVLARLGPDPTWSSQGRAPILYERK